MSTQSEIMEAMGFRTVYTKHAVVREVQVIIQLSMPHESDKGEVTMVTAHGTYETATTPPRYVHSEVHGFRTLEDALEGVANVVNEVVDKAHDSAPAKWITPELAQHWYETASATQMQMEF